MIRKTNIDILKLDVEGKELDIIKSLVQGFKDTDIKIIKIERFCLK